MESKRKAPIVAPEAEPNTETQSEQTIVSIKGFDQDWTCRGYQFALGGTYTHDGDVIVCESGFHAVGGYPLEVFDYYRPGQSRYAEVTQSGTIARDYNDSKIASGKPTVTVELSLDDLVKRAVAWITKHATGKVGKHTKGNQSAASSTGDQSAAMSSGREGQVQGAEGCALFLVYRDPIKYDILHAWAGIAGRDGIKPLTWYRLGSDGHPVEIAA